MVSKGNTQNHTVNIIIFIVLVGLVGAGLRKMATLQASQGPVEGRETSTSHVQMEQFRFKIESDPEIADVVITDGVNTKRGTTVSVYQFPQGAQLSYTITAREPHEYNLYKPFTGNILLDRDTTISVWIERTTAEEQQAEIAEIERERAAELAAQCMRLREDVEIIIENWSWFQSSTSYVRAEGQVRNMTDKTLRNVRVQVEFYTDDRLFITSGSALVDYTTLLPGQATPFTVLAGYNPAMKRAQLYVMDGRDYFYRTMRRADYDGDC